jgi:hypothetical protein
MSRHPELNDGIQSVLVSLRPLLHSGVVESVGLVLLPPPSLHAGGGGGGGGEEQYTFHVNLRSSPEVPATYSDVDTMAGAALTHLLLHGETRAAAAKDGSWTIVVDTHEGGLAGPNDAGLQHGTAAAASSSSGGGAGVLAPGSKWIRVDAGDPAGRLALAARAPPASSAAAAGASSSSSSAPQPRPGVRSAPLKTILAGPLCLQLTHDTRR